MTLNKFHGGGSFRQATAATSHITKSSYRMVSPDMDSGTDPRRLLLTSVFFDHVPLSRHSGDKLACTPV
jgi:hypothetical protein